MALRLGDKVVECLTKHPDEKFTAFEIAKWIFETYPDECREKQRLSKATVAPLDNDEALLKQIAAEMARARQSIQKKHPKIKTTEGRPRKYYFTEVSDIFAVSKVENESSSKESLKEKDLYPKIALFLKEEFKIYSKRIDEKRSKNQRGQNGNKWLYPDLVGMEALSQSWHREIKDCVQQYSDKKTKLWSCEVKILINRSNVREVFFQTVSNSSWANLGYLVASEIGGAFSRLFENTRAFSKKGSEQKANMSLHDIFRAKRSQNSAGLPHFLIVDGIQFLF